MSFDRRKWVNEIQGVLGGNFMYYLNRDRIEYQRVDENEIRTIFFKYNTRIFKNRENMLKEIKEEFEPKVEELKAKYPWFNIFGGNFQDEGYLIMITFNTVEELNSRLQNITNNYNQEKNEILNRIEALKNL